MYVPIHTDRKCNGCVFLTRPFCHIREQFVLPEATSRSAVLVCRSLLTQRGIPQHQVLDYHWRSTSDHSTLEG